jgi:lipoprotein-anchoring transpeptidase ErfK/SrfK
VRRRLSIALVSVVALLLVAVGAVVAYAGSDDGKVPKGVTVDGIDIGGLTAAQARAKLERQLLEPLQEPLRVDHGSRSWTLGPEEARTAVNVDAVVNQAIEAGDEGSIFTKGWRKLTGGEVDERLTAEVTYSKDAVVRLLDRVRKADRDPIDAAGELTTDGPRLVDGRPGLKVEASRLHEQLRAAMDDPSAERRFVARTDKVAPKVTTDEVRRRYDTALVVQRGSFKLRLYKDMELVKTYPIALGKAGMETPSGQYSIANKAVDPAWHVPNSDWAGDLAGKVIPGGVPENPIKSRWMGIYDGVGIHGTADRASIGSNASHGCVRMLVEDVEDLYDRVPVGTPIYIG